MLDRPALLDRLGSLEQIETAARTGEGAARARTHSGIVVELRAVAPEQFGSLLAAPDRLGAHNAALRERAVRMGLHLSEYGVLDDATQTTRDVRHRGRAVRAGRAAARSSRSCARTAARSRRRSRARCRRSSSSATCAATCTRHTTASDGRASIEEMALAARERGLEYLAITDHSASHGFGDDVSPDQLRRQIELVREADARIDGITLLAGSEVNILPDGSLDYDDELLAAARLGDRERAHRVRARRRRDDRARDRRRAASAGRRDRPPHRPPARAPPAVRDRRRRGVRRLRAGRHADRDQLQPRPARPRRGPRARRRGRRASAS